MDAPRNVLMLASALIAMVLMQTHLAESRTDHVLPFCRNMCSLEGAIAEQCVRDNCGPNSRPRCTDHCYRDSTRCWRFCRRKFSRIFAPCDTRCWKGEGTNLDTLRDCTMECFVDRAMAMWSRRQNRGGRSLPPPVTPPTPPPPPPPPNSGASSL